MIEAKVKPADIAFIQVGQDATLKLDAYDYSIYGGLNAKVIQISPSTIMSKDGESHYEVKLRSFSNRLKKNNLSLTIIPGMTAKVDIRTGRKSVFDYIMKPIFKAKSSALRER